MSDSRPPDEGPSWPERDLQGRDADLGPEPETIDRSDASDASDASDTQDHAEAEEADAVGRGPRTEESPATEVAQPVTAFTGGEGPWNPRLMGERRRPTTAEEAVPWLIGMILALAGIVIVLLALIFTSPDGLVGGLPSASPTPIGSDEPSIAPTPSPSPTPREASATAEPTPAPSATPAPSYGPLEMVYLGRASTLAAVQLLRRDFTTTAAPIVMAESSSGIQKYAWSPDGRVGAALVAGRLVALTPGQESRTLAEGIIAATFGWDADVLYAVHIVRDGANDRAEILEMGFLSGESNTVATTSYPHPDIAAEPALREAQFIDNGGIVRIYAAADGNLVVWILGAPATYRVDPGDGSLTPVDAEPLLWSPDGRLRIGLTENANVSTVIGLHDRSGDVQASVTVTGLVSHIRWAPTSNEIVFTLGRTGAAGGVRQDLYVWDLQNGKAPSALTSNGVSFGAEWLGVMANWVP